MRVLLASLTVCMLALAMGGAADARPREAQRAAPTLPQATEARLAGDETRTRLVVDLDRHVEVGVSAMADPPRVVVDLPEVTFRFGPNTGAEGRGLVTAFRYGQFAPGRSRIVVDVKEPALVDRAFVLPPTDGQPARLVVDMVRSTAEEVRRAAARAVPVPETRPAPQPQPTPPSRPRAQAPAPAVELPLVVLDPGHGGIDTGASSADGHTEKQIVLDIAMMLRDALQATGRVRVALTRDGDTFLRLDDRVAFARERRAALFVSIHADSFARPLLGVSGASVYTVSDRASDREAAAYAERENRADLIAGLEQPPANDEVADILFDLMHRETRNFSVHFARLLVGELRPHVRLIRNPHRFAGFRVLRAPDVPSALLELGFLSNRDDVRQLMDPAWRRKLADAFSRAVVSFVRHSTAASHGTEARVR